MQFAVSVLGEVSTICDKIQFEVLSLQKFNSQIELLDSLTLSIHLPRVFQRCVYQFRTILVCYQHVHH